MQILVTGASGYLGQPTVRALQRHQHQVVALARSDGENRRFHSQCGKPAGRRRRSAPNAVAIYTPYTLRFAVLLTVANSFLDAHTYLVRGGVFANLQTGNVILFAIHMSERHWGDSLSRLWPMFACVAGVVLSSYIKSGRVDKVVAQPLRWTMAIQAAVLAGFGFLPATLPHSLVVVPISFLGGIQIGLFRSIGDLAYMPLATTGNLMRVVEAGYDFFVEKNSSSRRAFMVYAGVIGAFAAGAIAGAFTTRAWGLHAIWVPAGLLAVTLILFVIDEREGTASK
jgi:uncharacterized membrane protein YoaK (UPF0700 family)